MRCVQLAEPIGGFEPNSWWRFWCAITIESALCATSGLEAMSRPYRGRLLKVKSHLRLGGATGSFPVRCFSLARERHDG
jgi:hypothetical protein